jgi:uncharacterized phage-associated protein
MKPNATALANYFIDLAHDDQSELHQLGLMKRVYITHGFSLAVLDLPAIDERFDKVEAWKNGPVIPSVYHSFKHNRNNPITEKSVITDWSNNEFTFEIPELEDNGIKQVANFVWNRYKGLDDFQMVELTHKKGTPWYECYIEGMNMPIPDIYTKIYYKSLLK